MPEQWIKKLQGKAADVYSKPEESGKLTEAYVEAYDSLRVFGEQASAQVLDKQVQRIEDLEAENEKLRKELEVTKVSMRQEFEDFKRMIFEKLKE